MNSEDIGKQIVILREERGLSQKDLAEKIPVSPATLSRWENGVIIPPISQLVRISDVLSISLENIFLGNKESYEKMKNRYIWVRILIFVIVILFFLGLFFAFMPKYRVVSEEENYRDDYGKSLIIYAKPTLFITERSAYSYGNRYAQEKLDNRELDVLEVVFVKTASDYYDEENVYFSNLYFLKNFSFDENGETD